MLFRSLFIGFILFAIPIVIIEEKENLKGKYKSLIFIILGIVLVVAITLLNPTGGSSGIDLANLNFGLGLYLFFVAMIAISAMVLPGISGSTILLIFGIYVPIVTAIKEIMHFNFEYLPVVVIFGLGIIAGIILIIKLIQKCLEKYRSQTIYAIIGMMIGSIYSIVMGPTTLKEPQVAMSFETFNVIFFIIGVAIILGLQTLKTYMNKKENNK